MYGIELAYLAGKKYSRARHDLIKKVSAVASVANIPEIMMHRSTNQGARGLLQRYLKWEERILR